jgi:putative phage-type endonuclease
MAKVFTNTKDMSRAEWLEQRNKGLGGSDISAILGLNKYKTAFELYLEKNGQVELQEIDNEAVYWGNVMEDIVAKEFEKRTGLKLRKRNAILQHDEYEFAFANVDRLVVGKNEGFEAKTASAYLMNEWKGEEIPQAYLVQCLWYMGITGADRWHIAALVGGNTFIYKTIERDQELINVIFEQAAHFWEFHIKGNNPPALDGSSAAEKYIKERFEKAEKGKTVDLKAEHKDNISKYLEVKRIIEEYKQEQTRLENLLKYDLAEAESGRIDRFVVNWKNVTSNRVDSKALKEKYPEIAAEVTKASNSRRFEIKEVKE